MSNTETGSNMFKMILRYLLLAACFCVLPMTIRPAHAQPNEVQQRHHTRWQVSWFTYSGTGQRGGTVGASGFGSTFNYNWLFGEVWGGYSDYIGFSATAEINMQRTGMVTFAVGSDDGLRLEVDGQVVIDDWSAHPYRERTVTLRGCGID